MKYCTNCGAELREGESFCPHCGQKISVTEPVKKPVYTEAEFELEDDGEWESPAQEESSAEATRPEPRKQAEPVRTAEPRPMGNANGPTQSSAPQSSQKPEPAPKKKFSGLSIAAFICSLTIVLSGLGILLAIIDLVKSRTQPRKKGLSIAALIIAGIFMLLAFIGNNIDLETLMAPKEETFAEIRGGTVYAADGFEVAVGNDNWVLANKQNNLLVFCPAAEKEQEGGPATSIWVAGPATGINSSKSPEEYVELALITERNSVSGKPKSLTVNGNYKGAWAEGKRDSRTTRMAAWKVEDRLFSIAYYGVGLDRDGEAVYQDILNSFTLRTPQDAAASEASQEASDVPTQTNAPVLDGTLVYSPADEFDFAFTLNDPGWKADFFDDGVTIEPTDDNKGQTGRILVTTIPIAQLSAREQDPDVIVTDFMKSLAPSSANDLSIFKVPMNGGYLASLAEGWTENNWVEVAVWMAGKHAYLMALIDSESHGDAEKVFYGIMYRFRLASEVAPQAAQEEKPDVPAAALSDRVVSLSLGDHFVLGLRENGTVSLLPDIVYDHSEFGKVSEWRDLAAVETETIYSTFILGLKKDGTVVCLAEKNLSGYSSAMQEIKTWHDIVSIEAGIYAAYGIQKDGTVKIARFDLEKIDHYRMNDKLSAAEKWSNLIALKEIGTDLYGITADGSVLSTNLDMNRVFPYCIHIADLDGYYIPTGDLRDDGCVENLIDACRMLAPNIYDIYHRYDLPEWTNIKKILVFEHHALGLKNDGTVESVRSDSAAYADLGQDQVSGWTDIIDIVGDTYKTIGLKEDGTLVLAGIDTGFNLTAWK